MSETNTLSAEDAIQKGFEYFNKLIVPEQKYHVLLEGLKLSDDQKEWIITIGFEIGREKVVDGPISMDSLFPGQRAREPIREFSRIHIDATNGSFTRLN